MWNWSVAFEISVLNISKDLFWRVWLIISVFNLQLFVEILWHWCLWRYCKERSQAGTGVRCHTGYREWIPLICSLTAAKRARCAVRNPQHKANLVMEGSEQFRYWGWYFPFHIMQRNCFFMWEDIDRKRDVDNKQTESYVSGEQDLSARFADIELFLLVCILCYERLSCFYCCC